MIPPGYSVRPATWEDVGAVAELEAACSQAEYGSPAGEEQDVRDDWVLPRVDLETDTWLVHAADGTLAGYGIVIDELEGIEFESLGMVHPSHRGRGVGSMLLDLIDDRALAINDGHGGVIRSSFAAPGSGVAELYATRGYRLARSMVRMDAELGAPIESVVPEGVDIKAFEPQREARDVHAALMEAFARHYGFVEQPFEEWADTVLHRPGFDPGMCFVAVAGGEVAGVLIGVIRVDIGWIADLGVRDAWRRRGIGEALVRHAMEDFRRRGHRSVGLNVDPQNETGAMRLYERLGFRIERRFDFYEKELTAGGSTSG